MGLANHLEYRQAVADNRLISPKAYQEAISQAESTVYELNKIMTHMQPGRYIDAPVTYDFFFPEAKVATPTTVE